MTETQKIQAFVQVIKLQTMSNNIVRMYVDFEHGQDLEEAMFMACAKNQAYGKLSFEVIAEPESEDFEDEI